MIKSTKYSFPFGFLVSPYTKKRNTSYVSSSAPWKSFLWKPQMYETVTLCTCAYVFTGTFVAYVVFKAAWNLVDC